MRIAVVLIPFAAVLALHPARADVDAFRSGLQDRSSYEAWFGSLTGDVRGGAEYWAGQRSLRSPGSCYAPNGQFVAGWTVGCQAAQQRLALSDARRRSEPDYKAGWNSLQVAAPVTPAMPSEDQERVAGLQAAEAARAREASYQAAAARAAAEKAQSEERTRAALVAAETAPDNNCRRPKFAGDMMKAIDELKTFKTSEVKVIDVEHLTTRKWENETLDVVCHGVFVFDNDQRIAATFETRPNVAGDMLTRWAPD